MRRFTEEEDHDLSMVTPTPSPIASFLPHLPTRFFSSHMGGGWGGVTMKVTGLSRVWVGPGVFERQINSSRFSVYTVSETFLKFLRSEMESANY